jgi:hypothetical protein
MTMGIIGDFASDADNLARRAWKALLAGKGMRLSANEVVALHEAEGDGEWWQSFNPAHPTKDAGND